SFATYGEYLWNEYKYGRDEADAAFYRSRGGYMAESGQKMAELVRFEYKAREDMFDGHSYNKGGQVLNMLRRYVGDDAFFASLKLYLERYRFQAAEMHMLRLCFEEVTGEDLNWFFNEWCYSKGHPSLKIENSYDTETKNLTIRVVQQQDFAKLPLFKLPVKVDIYVNGQVRKELIWIKEADQKFVFGNVNSKPDLVNFDAEKALLCDKNENKTLDEFIFQYKNAPLYLDRLEALEYFKNYKSDPKVYETIKLALTDKYDELRVKAIHLLGDAAKDKENELRPILVNIAKTDKESNTRGEAIDFLSEFYTNGDLLPVYTAAMEDKSYRVIGSALSAIAKNNPKEAMEKAKTMENETTPGILFSVMDIYSKNGTEANNDFFMRSAKNFGGFSAIGYYNMYGLFLKKCNYETVLKGAEFIRDKMKGSANKYVKFYAQKAIKDEINRANQDMEQLNIKIEAAKKAGTATGELDAEMNNLKGIKEKLDGFYSDIQK
ncbi:MAG: DUF3458 domain-containing protein, partial [Bacteroidia bacterium]|nr:DUF3458 domain-containing protein [Bacteroidia bacterium]